MKEEEIDLELMYEKETSKEWHRSYDSEYIEWLEKKLIELIVKKIAEQQCDISVVGSSMVVLMDNTTKNDYGLFTDKIVAIKKQGQTIILEPQDLKQLEKTLGCKFKI